MTDFNTPWTYDKTTGCIIGSDGHSIAYVSGHMRHDGDPDALACGSLIAAAPALYRALIRARDVLSSAGVIGEFYNGISAAIAAAEGRTTP